MATRDVEEMRGVGSRVTTRARVCGGRLVARARARDEEYRTSPIQ